MLVVLGLSSDIFLEKVRPGEATRFWLTFAGAMLVFVATTWFFVGYRIDYDHHRIVIHMPWGRGRCIQWSDVTSVKYVEGSGIVVAIRGEKREVIASLVSGAADFMALAGQKRLAR